MEFDDPRLTSGRFLADAVARHGDHRAIHFEEREIRYDELLFEARRLARALIGAGGAKGARVAVHMANRPEWIVSAFAVGMLGGVLVPVNTFASRDEFDYIVRHSDASMLLLQPWKPGPPSGSRAASTGERLTWPGSHRRWGRAFWPR